MTWRLEPKHEKSYFVPKRLLRVVLGNAKALDRAIGQLEDVICEGFLNLSCS